jgi:hypothetical protein
MRNVNCEGKKAFLYIHHVCNLLIKFSRYYIKIILQHVCYGEIIFMQVVPSNLPPTYSMLLSRPTAVDRQGDINTDVLILTINDIIYILH